MAVSFPMSSNPSLHVYVELSPVELPVTFTSPLDGTVGYKHRAERDRSNTWDFLYKLAKITILTYDDNLVDLA